jgi:hypothetical protein
MKIFIARVVIWWLIFSFSQWSFLWNEWHQLARFGFILIVAISMYSKDDDNSDDSNSTYNFNNNLV